MFDLVRQKTAGIGPVLQGKLTHRKPPSPLHPAEHLDWILVGFNPVKEERYTWQDLFPSILWPPNSTSEPITCCVCVFLCGCAHMEGPDGPSFFQIKAFSPIKNDCPDKNWYERNPNLMASLLLSFVSFVKPKSPGAGPCTHTETHTRTTLISILVRVEVDEEQVEG